ncbi:GNAT family N-acetyltransferase [Oceanobacillus sp. 1P07AA]|uniref:GNAT family N-acetyltransferase n=1 Tax=Oceanobacillus sp. 1P07AA TaxID=3132293 RepID=UPI0039A75791
MYKDQKLTIRPIQEKDLKRLWELIYKEENPEWKQWDAPYFSHESMSYERFMKEAEAWINAKSRWVICVNNDVHGTVSYYYEDEQKNWLEMGIIFYEGSNWGMGYGTKALKLWINHLFEQLPVVRVGLTTWSGNKRMIRVAEKLGMMMEGKIRKVRYYNGEYYDSIRMGILREEWNDQ